LWVSPTGKPRKTLGKNKSNNVKEKLSISDGKERRDLKVETMTSTTIFCLVGQMSV